MILAPRYHSFLLASFIITSVCGWGYASPRLQQTRFKAPGPLHITSTDALEEQLLELKVLSGEESVRTQPTPYSVRVGQPEFTNEDLEDELTEVRPLDIPLQLLEVDDDHDSLHYITSTPRTLARPDAYFDDGVAYVASHDRDEEAEHSGDSTTVPTTYNKDEKDDDSDDEDDDDDDDDDDDEDDDESEESDGAGDDSDDSEEDEKADEDDVTTRRPVTELVPNNGGRLKPTPSGEADEIRPVTVEMPSDRVETTTSGPGALMRNLENFLGLTGNMHKRLENDIQKEAELDSGPRLEQVRELQRKADIPQQLVDAVSPRADEGLLELMVRIAEDPAEWHRVHMQLRQLDDDLLASRNSLEKLKSSEKAQELVKKSVESESNTTVSVTKMNASDENAVKTADVVSDQKKNKGPLKEEQERVAALDDEVNGDKSLRTEKPTVPTTSTDKPRPSSLEAEQKMVAGMDDEVSQGKFLKNKKLTGESTDVEDVSETPPAAGDVSGNTEKRSHNDIGRVNTKLRSNKVKTSGKEGKKKKKKKPKQKGKHKGNKTLKEESDIRRQQLEKAGVLIPVPKTNDQTQKGYDGSHLKSVTKFSDRWRGTSSNNHKTVKNPKDPQILNSNKSEKQTGSDNRTNNKSHDQKMATIDSAIAYLSDMKDSSNGKEPENKLEKVKSRHRDIMEKHESRKSDSPNSHPNSSKHSASKMTTSKGTRITSPPWQTLSSDNYRMPSKEERSHAKPPYYSDISSYDRPRDGWPNLSLDSIKHGGNSDKQWSAITNMVHQQKPQTKPNKDKLINNWPKFPPDLTLDKENSVDSDNWPNFETEHSDKGEWTKSSLESALTNHISGAWPQKEGGSHRTGGSRQWPHFAYHRVTSSPQVLAQQRARHRNAYIAVSVVAPPGKAKTLHKSAASSGPASSPNITTSVSNSDSSTSSSTRSTGKGEDARSAQPLPDKMDQLLAMRSEQRAMDSLEEQLIDAAAATSGGSLPWSHARHLDRIQEQLKTLSAMEEKLRYHWLEKERLRQILRDGGKNGAGFYREPRVDGTTTAAPTPTTSSPSPSNSAP